MKKYIIIVAILFVAYTSFSYKANATIGTIPFGGQVVSIQPCDSGLLLYLKGFWGITPYMWTYGDLPYLMHVPPHPGQYMLGAALPAMVPCVLGILTVGTGFPIIFHGSSL
jgi:hypothetical protein